VQLFRLVLAALIVACAAGGSQPRNSLARRLAEPSSPLLAALDPQDRDRLRAASDASADSPAAPSGNARAAASPKSRVLLGVYCVLIVGASLFGGWLPRRFVLSHTGMQTVVSLIAGLMLSIGVFHLLPHAVIGLGEDGADRAAAGLMAGLVGMFLILRLFGSHQHSPAGPFAGTDAAFERRGQSDAHSGHGEAPHGHWHGTAHGAHSLSWVGVCVGMSLHTLIDGLALAASVESDALQGTAGLWGVGTFLAVFLHKPIDSMSITSLMAMSGWSTRSQSVANSVFSLICPLGAGLFVLGLREFSGDQSVIVGWALAASAGVFLCIALCDLLPEMEFHSHNRVRLTAALLAGIALGWAITFLDPAHHHAHAHDESHVEATTH